MRTPLAWAADRWTLGPRALQWSTYAALVTSILIVLGGVTVRVTGSGLGCPSWPLCTEDSLVATPELGIHGAIEFGNRMITFLLVITVGWAIIAARLQKPRDRMLTRLAWSMFWLVVVNALAGGVTVLLDLNPWTVATHFLLATGLLACATFTWHRARWTGGGSARPSALARGLSWAMLAATVILVTTGTLVTGSGPHAGDSMDVPRMGFDWIAITIVHASASAAVLVLVLVLAFRLRREEGGRLALTRIGFFLAALLTQMALGTVQSLIGIPELLVAAHVVLGAMVWVGALRVVLDTDPWLFAVRDSHLDVEDEPQPAVSGV